MTQPINDPKFATGPDYTGTTDNGLPVRVTPSSGRRANGFDRDTRFAIPVLNEMLGVHGDYLDGLVDIAAYNWENFTSDGDTVVDNVYNAAYALVTLPPLNDQQHERLCFFNPAQPFYSLCDGDRESWVAMTAPGTGGTVKGVVPGFAGGTMHVICWDGDSGATNNVRKSSNYGASWSASGTIGGDITHGIYSPTLDRWFLTGSVGATTATVHVSDDLANSAWPTLTIPAEWNGALSFPVCIAQGSDGVVIGLNSGFGCVYTNDGVNLVVREIDPTADPISICFSESRQEWLAWMDNRTCWRAPAGMASWTQVFDAGTTAIGPTASPGTATGGLLVPFGRAYILGGARLNVSKDGGASWDRLPVKSLDGASITALTKIGGRIVGAAQVTEGAHVGTLHLFRSLRLPGEYT